MGRPVCLAAKAARGEWRRQGEAGCWARISSIEMGGCSAIELRGMPGKKKLTRRTGRGKIGEK